jgi:hypothetical protein
MTRVKRLPMQLVAERKRMGEECTYVAECGKVVVTCGVTLVDDLHDEVPLQLVNAAVDVQCKLSGLVM